MAQAILTKVDNKDGEIILTFVDSDKNVHTGKYTGNLKEEQLRGLTGTQIAFTGGFTEKEEQQDSIGEITRAWETDENKPVYSSETYAGDDRAR